MATTNYVTVNGMIIGESTSGVNRAYCLDALGSVVATYEGTSVQNTYQYKPYGGLLAKTGTAPDPSFLWNGGSGYRATKVPSAEYYVRRRHLSSTDGRWAAIDPLWPKEAPYAYAGGCVPVKTDPSGLQGGGQGLSSSTAPNTTVEPGYYQAWARVFSTQAVFGIQGWITLPWACDTYDCNDSSYVDFWLAIRGSGGTQFDCGVSLECNRGWAIIANRGGDDSPGGCGACGPGVPIFVSLTYQNANWNCTVSGSPTTSLQPNKPLTIPAPAEMAMGAGWPNYYTVAGLQVPALFSEPAHSPAIWDRLALMQEDGTWQPWTGFVPYFTPTFTMNPASDIVGGYLVTSLFPSAFVAMLGSTNNLCGCTSAKVPLGAGISPW